MGRKVGFPVICIVFLAVTQLNAQFQYQLAPPGSPWSSVNFNEIQGNVRAIRPTPGVLIAGHHSPVAVSRPTGPATTGLRHFLANPSPPTTSWPRQGPQIQRAKESSHIEYEVFPHRMHVVNQRKPLPLQPPLAPVLRQAPAPSRVRPVFVQPDEVPPEILRFLSGEGINRRPSARPMTRPQSRTDRPTITIMPTPVAATDADFREGYRILSDLFMEDATREIRNNLVGGSEISFNGGFFPMASMDAAAVQTPPQPQIEKEEEPKKNETTEATVKVEAEEEEPLATKEPEVQQVSTTTEASQMEESESSFGPPRYTPGPPRPAGSHSSFMFTDPLEGPEGYDGEYGGPPPPFHHTSNSLSYGPPPGPPPPPRRPSIVDVRKVPERRPTAGPTKEPTGFGQMPFMMMPISEVGSDIPAPSSEEVQSALQVLARYASRQAQQMQRDGSIPGPSYGPPAPSTVATMAQSSPSGGAQPVSLRGQVKEPSIQYTTPGSISAKTEASSPHPVYGPPPGQGGGGDDGFGSGGYGVGGGSSGSYGAGGGGGSAGEGLIGAKVEALKNIQSAVAGGFKQITGFKSGILNAGLSAIGSLGKAKAELTNSLMIPSKAPSYGPPTESSTQVNLLNAVKDIAGGITGTIGQTGRAAIGIGLSKNHLVRNHFAIKGQAFTETVSKKLQNQNQFFQNVLGHIQSIFDAAAAAKPGQGGGHGQGGYQ